MKFGGRANKRSEIPSFREFINQEKILKESGIIDDKEIDYEVNKVDTSKERSDKKNKNKK